MKPANYKILATALAVLFAASGVPGAQIAPSGQILDPAAVAWPRTFTADGYDMAIFQPQISIWKGNQLAGRFAVGIRPTGSKDEAYGVVSFTALTYRIFTAGAGAQSDPLPSWNDGPAKQAIVTRWPCYLVSIQTKCV